MLPATLPGNDTPGRQMLPNILGHNMSAKRITIALPSYPLGPQELGDALNISIRTVYRLIDSDPELRERGFRVGNQWRFAPADILAWLNGEKLTDEVSI